VTDLNDRIRAYLLRTMSPEELAAFELAMFEDPELADAVEAERQLRIGLREYCARQTPGSTDQGD
jgi:hypothetical protein